MTVKEFLSDVKLNREQRWLWIIWQDDKLLYSGDKEKINPYLLEKSVTDYIINGYGVVKLVVY